MIKIDKTHTAVPNILLTNGSVATIANNTAYSAGTRKFKFANTIYGDTTVKDTLINLQSDKCCFCERKVSAGEPGHIEHYRPKGGYKKDDTSKLVKPGYYWLAYNFDNLYFSCNRCNTSYKKNYFPLADESTRAKNHTENIANEDPLIINPSVEPSTHLVFKREKIKAKGKSIKGKETIKRTGLNRKLLSQERLEYLLLLDTLAKVARGKSAEAMEAQNHFKRISKKENVFSYMVICNYPDLV
jgi:uncharacterized protein (TIGR02646 family)